MDLEREEGRKKKTYTNRMTKKERVREEEEEREKKQGYSLVQSDF